MNTATGEVATMKEAIRLYCTNVIDSDWKILSISKILYRECKNTERHNILRIPNRKIVMFNDLTGEVATIQTVINNEPIDCHWLIWSSDRKLYNYLRKQDRRNWFATIRKKISKAIDFINRLPIDEHEIREQYLWRL